MQNKQILKELNKIQKTVGDLIKQINYSQKPLSPFQSAVKKATSKNSSDQDVKDALNVFVESAEQLTVNQFSFVVFFLAVNKQHLSDDVNWFVGIELGKHRYNQRDTFIDSVIKVLSEKYKSNSSVVNSLTVYLTNLKRK